MNSTPEKYPQIALWIKLFHRRYVINRVIRKQTSRE